MGGGWWWHGRALLNGCGADGGEAGIWNECGLEMGKAGIWGVANDIIFIFCVLYVFCMGLTRSLG